MKQHITQALQCIKHCNASSAPDKDTGIIDRCPEGGVLLGRFDWGQQKEPECL